MYAVVTKTVDPRPILRSTAFPFPAAVVPLVTIEHIPSHRPPPAHPSPAEPSRGPEPRGTPKTR
ncbi:hypothetical protein [Streptomyces phaeochromogenes]|uniref:hypothetical protein n=1 Tax=Streptomyces phaeochromogenes TaxID=1923 RepID=UPI002DDC880C|nr:hypothetical protein [Streptomyces phaeochromogenes]WRZ34727.1 hypothetical protein OG931_46830 [Streptomyces phaeochromogenes]